MKSLRITAVFLLIFFLALPGFSQEQLTIHGTVSDFFSKKPLAYVSVFTSGKSYAISDSAGVYNVTVNTGDSIWFSYLGRQTQKYPADTISHPENFDIALYVDVKWLPEVKVQNRNYHQDSVQNRQDYAKVFNFHKPGLKVTDANPSTYTPGSLTVGFDLDEIINAFRFRRNRQLLSFQERLIQEEQDKYIDHRFSKAFVTKLTGLKGDTLTQFITTYRPAYETLLQLNDLELGYYIEQCYKNYLLLQRRREFQNYFDK